MQPKRRRPPLLAAALTIVLLGWGVRSLWRRDALIWQSLDQQVGSVITTTFGVDVEHFGVGLFYEQRLAPPRDQEGIQQAIESTTPGLSFKTEAAEIDGASWMRRIGVGFDRKLDDRPESFENSFLLRFPIWLFAGLLAIAPVRYLKQRMRATENANVSATTRSDSMKLGLAIGALAGAVIAGMAVYFIVRSVPPPAKGDGVAAAPGPMAGNPIVGLWRLSLSSITVFYDFKDDGSFSQRFKGVPIPPTGSANAHEAFGSWYIDGTTLVMRNTSSTTPFTVVDEEETATIVSTTPTTLVLKNVDRKGRDETLSLTHVERFVKGAGDKPALIGSWQSSQAGAMEFKQGGELLWAPRGSSFSNGAWMQKGDKLRLMIDPPASPQFPSRNWVPELHDTRDVTLQILDLSSDGQSLTLLMIDPTRAAAPTTYARSTVQLAPPPAQTGRPRRGAQRR